jgi:hypothetical protein
MANYIVKLKLEGSDKPKSFKTSQPSSGDAEREALRHYPKGEVVNIERGGDGQSDDPSNKMSDEHDEQTGIFRHPTLSSGSQRFGSFDRSPGWGLQ